MSSITYIIIHIYIFFWSSKLKEKIPHFSTCSTKHSCSIFRCLRYNKPWSPQLRKPKEIQVKFLVLWKSIYIILVFSCLQYLFVSIPKPPRYWIWDSVFQCALIRSLSRSTSRVRDVTSPLRETEITSTPHHLAFIHEEGEESTDRGGGSEEEEDPPAQLPHVKVSMELSLTCLVSAAILFICQVS